MASVQNCVAMLTLIPISALLYTLVVFALADENQGFLRDVSLPAQDSVLMANGTHLFTILYSNVSHGTEQLRISVNSTNGQDLNTCNLTVRFEPDKDRIARGVRNLLKGAVLGDGRHIVTWSLHWNNGSSELRPLLIELQQCNYKSLLLPIRPNDVFIRQLPWIVPYKNSFDIFFESDESPQKCMPCRFSDQGEQIELNGGIKEVTSTGPFLFQPLDITNTSKGYFYVRNSFDLPNETATVQLLNSTFNVLKETVVDYNVEAMSTYYNNDSLWIYLGKIWTKNWHGIYYQRYNSNLDLKYCTVIPLFWGQIGQRMSLNVDSNGYSHLSLTVQETNKIAKKYRYIRLDASGMSDKVLEFGKFEGATSDGETQNLIVGDHYCLVSLEMDGNGAAKRTIVRCIDVRKKYETKSYI